MAVITYLILRAGFISGSPTTINDFGVAGISALVGLMTDEITRKLRDVFDTLFGIAKPKGEKGRSPLHLFHHQQMYPAQNKTSTA
jgi:hypothetical protein